MAVVQPFNTRFPGYLVSQSGAANFNGLWFDTRKCKTLWVQITYNAAASVGSTFTVQGTEDDSFAATNFFMLSPTYASTNAGIATVGTSVTVPIPDAASAGSTVAYFENCPSYCRIAYLVGTSSSKVLNTFIGGKAT